MILNDISTMNRQLSSIIGMTFIIAGYSCKEVYYPEEIYSAEKIPVIQGGILEDNVPSVELSWAVGYKDQVREYISGARVYVTDNLGNSVDLAETSPGNYIALSDEFKGVQGRIYTLHAELPDGNAYSSTPVLLEKNPLIDSVYASPVRRTAYSYNLNNKPVPEEQQGLLVKADLTGEGKSALYYRFNTKVVKEMLYTVNLYTPEIYSIFLWEVFTLDNLYTVNSTATQNNYQVLQEHPVGFLRYFYDVTLETESSTAPYTAGWVLTFNVYSISGEVYHYYNSIAKQLNSNDQLFAPLPSQIRSTIHCLNDPDQEVIGVFEANSLTTIYKAFGWNDMNSYYAKDLASFPDIVQGDSSHKFPPDFWISF